MTAALFAFYVVGAFAGLFIGLRFGVKRGRDIEWIEQTLARSRADKNRRDRHAEHPETLTTMPVVKPTQNYSLYPHVRYLTS